MTKDNVPVSVEAEATPVEAEAKDVTDYIEFVGSAPYGTEFYNGYGGTHTIFKAQMKSDHDIDLGAKEVVWRKGSNGRMLVRASDMSPEAAELLSNDPMFKRVSL